jgi:hypothetical protein
MTSPNDRPTGTGIDRETDDLRQPAQEIVDPREENPEPDAPDVGISGAREPVADGDGTGAADGEH